MTTTREVAYLPNFSRRKGSHLSGRLSVNDCMWDAIDALFPPIPRVLQRVRFAPYVWSIPPTTAYNPSLRPYTILYCDAQPIANLRKFAMT